MRTTHKDRVLRHLRDYGTISSMEAFREYGITRLSAVIFTLREEGYTIKTVTKTAVNRYGEKVRYGEYTLVE